MKEFVLPGGKNRLLSLDILRGLTIAGMIIVNDPGSWGNVYPMLLHADWHGITPTDLVFPFFLFIVGISIALAYTKRIKSGIPKGKMIRKIFSRTLIIFGIGLFLWLFPNFEFSKIRLPGVLQRIALVFGACSLMFLYFNKWKQQAWIGAILLILYWALMALVPVPIDETITTALETGQVLAQSGMIDVTIPIKIGESFVAANFEPGTNLEAWVDRTAIPFRLWQYSWDPEGLLSTIPAIGTGITGILVGQLWLSKDKPEKRLIWMFVIGLAWLVVGCLWHYAFPINKNLWTSSYVMFTSGLCTLLFAATIWLVDIQKHHKGIFPLVVFGTNAIAAYVLHSLLNTPIGAKVFSGGTASFKGLIYNGMVNLGIPANLSSFLWALFYTWLIYLIVWVMYKRKIFLKI
jgi:predicted acyltransferase